MSRSDGDAMLCHDTQFHTHNSPFSWSATLASLLSHSNEWQQVNDSKRGWDEVGRIKGGTESFRQIEGGISQRQTEG